MRIGARLALPLALRRVRRTAAAVLAPEAVAVVSEMVEDLSLELLDVLAVLGAAATVLGATALIAALLIHAARPL